MVNNEVPSILVVLHEMTRGGGTCHREQVGCKKSLAPKAEPAKRFVHNGIQFDGRSLVIYSDAMIISYLQGRMLPLLLVQRFS